MAEFYATTGSRVSVKVLDENTVIDVEAIGIVTKPTGIRLTVPVPMPIYTSGGAPAFLEEVGHLVEDLCIIPAGQTPKYISGGTGSQQVDQNGLIAYFITFVVSYTPTGSDQGTFEGTVTIPVAVFESGAAFDFGLGGTPPAVAIEDEYNRLVALANA